MQLYSWGARALFLGESLRLSAHRNAVALLALGLDVPFSVAVDPSDPEAGYRSCRSALIPPNTLHHFKDTVGNMAFLYLDPLSAEWPRLRALARQDTARAGFDLSIEEDLLEVLGSLAIGRLDWRAARARLRVHLQGPAAGEVDPRAQDALSVLHDDPASRASLEDLAGRVGLSASRLRRLIKAATGVPFRRYRLWIAMGAAVRAIAQGKNLTTSALDAGFSSSSHFSSAFREMFGMEPSRLSRGRLEASYDTW